MAEKRESELKSILMAEFKICLPRFVALRHEDVRKNGTPDISVTGAGRTSWLEVKHGTPHISSRGNQEATCIQLAHAGFCRYIIYWESASGDIKRTYVVHPRSLRELMGSWAPGAAEASVSGFDHRFIVDYLRQIHRV